MKADIKQWKSFEDFKIMNVIYFDFIAVPIWSSLTNFYIPYANQAQSRLKFRALQVHSFI